MKNLAQDDSVAGFFTSTDLFPSPPDAFFETVDHLVFGSCKFRLVFAMPADSSPIWSTWLDHWATSGRAMTLATVSRLKMRLYGQQKEQWVWENSVWEFLVVEGGTAPIGSSIDSESLLHALGPLIRQVKGEYWLPPPPASLASACHSNQPPPSQHRDGFSQSEVDRFWQQWDDLAKQREALLRTGNTDWEKLFGYSMSQTS